MKNLTREQINKIRKQAIVSHADSDALCDMALRSLDGEQEPIPEWRIPADHPRRFRYLGQTWTLRMDDEQPAEQSGSHHPTCATQLDGNMSGRCDCGLLPEGDEAERLLKAAELLASTGATATHIVELIRAYKERGK